MSRLWCFMLLAVCMAGVQAHEDLLGTRHVAANGIDRGDCRHADRPCRSIEFAWNQSLSGDLIKVAEGAYKVDDVSLDRWLFGAVKIIGGYSTGDAFRAQSADQHRTVLIGGRTFWAASARARGFEFVPLPSAGPLRTLQSGTLSFDIDAAINAQAAAASACVQGSAAGRSCKNIDLLAHMPLTGFSSQPASASNLWGFVDRNDQREYVILGLSNGTAVVDITDPTQPREVGIVRSNSSIWREAKVYQFFDAAAGRHRAYAYMTTEAANTGLEIIDLTQLPNSVSLASRLSEFGSAHTLYVSNVEYAGMTPNTSKPAFLYIAGANINGGAYLIYDLANPTAPVRVTTAPANTGYMHDSTSLLISDARAAQCAPGHSPCEVLVDFNESSVDLWDVTEKTQPLRISTTTYPTARYTHSGWPSSDGQFLFVHDELDELRIGSFATHIYTLDIANLAAPQMRTSYVGPTTTTDHNGYAKGDRYYVAHYRRGLVVFDTLDPNNLREVGSFDTFLNPAVDVAGTDGAWGTYPFFPSGTLVVSDIDNGLFVLADHTIGLANRVGRLGFAATSVSVLENQAIDVTIRRVDGRQGAASVAYATADGSAQAGADYQSTSGTLTWNDGDDSDRTVRIPLTNDSAAEGSETLTLALSAASTSLDGSATLSITISDDDIAVAPARSGGGGRIPVSLLGLLAVLGIVRRHRR